MKTRNLLTMFAAITLLAGCSLIPERKPVDYKSGATSVPALEVPPDLTQHGASQRYVIPAADGTQVTKYSDYSRDTSAVEQPCVAPAAPAEVATVSAARLMEIDGLRFVLLTESFDRAWRKVGLALDRAAIAAGDVDRSKGIIYLKADPKNKSAADLRVLVRETQGATVVTVSQGGDSKAKEAARVLDVLFQNLEK